MRTLRSRHGLLRPVPRRQRPRLVTWQDYEAEARYQIGLASAESIDLFGGPAVPMERAMRYIKLAEMIKRLEDLHA